MATTAPPAPHLVQSPQPGEPALDPIPVIAGDLDSRPGPSRQWTPKRVLITKSALEWEHGRAIAERVAKLGVNLVELPNDRVKLDFSEDSRRQYAESKATMAVVVAPPSKRKLQPIAPSADWRVDLAEGCPAHCSYCYLAGSLKGPPITRVYANLPEILEEMPRHLGQGTITSRSKTRSHEGTTYEASCYTDPLAIEHLTGSLSALIGYFGGWDADAQLRFTSKFGAVDPLLTLPHNGRTRMRASLNPKPYAKFEGGTSPVARRIAALRRMAEAGYPVGLTIAPIIAAPGWEMAYGGLIEDVARALDGLDPAPDLTVELITHRFTETSKAVLDSWYPGSALDMGPDGRTRKRTKFGAVKHVYEKELMVTMRRFFEAEIAAKLPFARVLYWT